MVAEIPIESNYTLLAINSTLIHRRRAGQAQSGNGGDDRSYPDLNPWHNPESIIAWPDPTTAQGQVREAQSAGRASFSCGSFLAGIYNLQLHRPMLPPRPVLSQSASSSRQRASSRSERMRRADAMINE